MVRWWFSENRVVGKIYVLHPEVGHQRFQLVGHVPRRTEGPLALEEPIHRAEFALEGTAPRGHDVGSLKIQELVGNLRGLVVGQVKGVVSREGKDIQIDDVIPGRGQVHFPVL